jgi:hypothetical protein
LIKLSKSLGKRFSQWPDENYDNIRLEAQITANDLSSTKQQISARRCVRYFVLAPSIYLQPIPNAVAQGGIEVN